MADNTKTCPYCAETIKAEAIVCRFCGRDLDKQAPVAATSQVTLGEQPGVGSTLGLLVRLFAVFFVLVAIVAALAALGGGGESAATSDWGSPAMAYTMTKDFVRDRLKAPATARFPAYSREFVQDFTAGRYKVTAYVDSENGFGAMIRTHFVAIVETDDGDTWRLESLETSP